MIQLPASASYSIFSAIQSSNLMIVLYSHVFFDSAFSTSRALSNLRWLSSRFLYSSYSHICHRSQNMQQCEQFFFLAFTIQCFNRFLNSFGIILSVPLLCVLRSPLFPVHSLPGTSGPFQVPCYILCSLHAAIYWPFLPSGRLVLFLLSTSMLFTPLRLLLLRMPSDHNSRIRSSLYHFSSLSVPPPRFIISIA